ncbi:Lhr family helicase [Chondromyces crocatus]|uniref:DEAD/DEAH box helicase n=1 Tax=Chondromyces crocatus TaxID=52 RepID=A0A0K1EAP3_CHOCO|nr:DEAD/DEAH box helicase [Chondromyces crocatus]AKT37747.1 DEAD/DEAH box helicase [Chondromyces crocatus]
MSKRPADPLRRFHEPTRAWFDAAFPEPTGAQRKGWPPILDGASTLLLAPTGSGKTLAAFLTAIDKLLFAPEPHPSERCRVLYVSPLKALAVDVERNLRAPLAGIAVAADRLGVPHRALQVGLRSGDTAPDERVKLAKRPPDILITTPESLYLLLTSNAREGLRAVETVIIDEIHAVAPTKRGAHLFLTLERLEAMREPGRPLQRIGLSATQRPLEEIARLLGGGEVDPQGVWKPREVTIIDASAPKALEISIEVPAEEMPAMLAGTGAPAPRLDDVRAPRAVRRASSTTEARTAEQGSVTKRASTKRASTARPTKARSAKRTALHEASASAPSSPALSEPGRSKTSTPPSFAPPASLASPPAPPIPPRNPSVWPGIHARLVELVRAHRSTMIFSNSRRLAERLAAALNDLAGDVIARAHHGSIAREQRQAIEEQLKEGSLPCIVATSSLELGLDLGAVDLVIQIEAPPSVAAGLQRIGRAGHHVGGTSQGIIFPKHRGDLLSCASASALMREGRVEQTRYPRSPLDVLAQQIVAITAMDAIHVDALFDLVRRAAPFAELPRSSFEGVLDMLSGRYPSDEFAELRPRIVWDRVGGLVRGREGAKRLAVVNAGTIPDRGLYGVFLATDEPAGKTSRRVGELDEEMVFEAREGEVFLLGASSWRITEITHDRVLVVPAPGEPGKMPFWRGDQVGRSAELGAAIGALTRTLAGLTEPEAEALLREQHGLDPRAAERLMRHVHDQAAATGDVPSDRTIVVERFQDEMGDLRICILSPFGGRVHAPLATCLIARARSELGLDIEANWTDDGVVIRLPEANEPPDPHQLLPQADEVEDLLVQHLGGTALFASRFRECAGRALLLPRRMPGKRAPLWQQRKRAADLLAVAARYGSFPMLLETYRECLRDVFDLGALQDLLRGIQSRKIRLTTVDTRVPSPFAASLLFSYVGNFMYEGDLPLAERRAQALTIDQSRLRELLGEAEMRELLDADAVAAMEATLQRLDGRFPPKHADQIHDLLLALGDLSRDELAQRCRHPDEALEAARARADAWVDGLLRERRIIEVRIGGVLRIAAAEDAGRLRDALGVMPPPGLPAAFLASVPDALQDLVARYARTHAPFHAEDVARRFDLGIGPVLGALERLMERGKVVEGELSPAGRGREHCDAEVLRILKRRSLSRLRAEVEPVEPETYARFLGEWHSLNRPRRGPEGLLAVIAQLQGAPLPASALSTQILPARVEGYRPGDLDALCAAGLVLWRGVDPIGDTDGRIALYLTEAYPYLAPPAQRAEGPLAEKVREALRRRGAVFFADLSRETGAFGADLLRALWDLVWAGEATNDTLAPLRSLGRTEKRGGRRGRERSMGGLGGSSFLPGAARGGFAVGGWRAGPPGSEGRWSLLPEFGGAVAVNETERRTALARVLLERHGVLTREAVQGEGITGGFSAVYDVLRAMEDAGKVRRGYFVAGLGAAQFALPGADDRLRACRDAPEGSEAITRVLAATDPASPWGAAVSWPEAEASVRPQRAAGALVVLREGRLIAWVGRTERSLLTFLPDAEPARGETIRAIAQALAALVDEGRRRSVLLATVNGGPVSASPIAAALQAAGFSPMSQGYLKRAGGMPRGDGYRERGLMPGAPVVGFGGPAGNARGQGMVPAPRGQGTVPAPRGQGGLPAPRGRGNAPDWLRRAAMGGGLAAAGWEPPPGVQQEPEDAVEGDEESDDLDDEFDEGVGDDGDEGEG